MELRGSHVGRGGEGAFEEFAVAVGRRFGGCGGRGLRQGVLLAGERGGLDAVVAV